MSRRNKRIAILFCAMLMIVLTVIPLSAQDTEQPQIDCALASNPTVEAREAATANDFERAIGFLNCALAQTPDNATLYGARGLAYLLTGDVDSALADYNTYQQMTGAYTPFMQAQIDGYTALSNPVSVQNAPATDTVPIVTPGDAISFFQRALYFQRRGEVQRAILDYERAIAIDATNPLYFGARGYAYILANQPELAITDFQQYESLTGTLHPVMVQLIMEIQRNDTLLDDPLSAEAVVLNPPAVSTNDATSYYQRGIYFSQNGEYERAILDYNVAISIDPNIQNVYAARGFAFLLIDEPEFALRDYDRYRDIAGEYAPFMQQQIEALRTLVAEQNSE